VRASRLLRCRYYGDEPVACQIGPGNLAVIGGTDVTSFRTSAISGGSWAGMLPTTGVTRGVDGNLPTRMLAR